MGFKDINTTVIIASPSFDGDSEYPANIKCSITLGTGTMASTVHLNFTFIDIEASEGCEVDSVTFLSVRICGRQPRMYTSEH